MKNTLSSGEGMWLWIVSRYMNGDLDKIVEEFKRAQFSYVIIKIADWAVKYNTPSSNPNLLKDLCKKLRNNNIEPWGFQYIYGINPALEAEVGAKYANELGLYGFVINAEKEFVNNYAKKTAAKTYMSTLKRIVNPDTLVGLSSYRYPYRYFLNYPWKEFLSGCDFYAPQVYWMGSNGTAARQLNESVTDIHKMYTHFGLPRLPIRPTGACFAEHGWKPTVIDIIEFKSAARAQGFTAVDWWEVANAYVSVRDGYDHICSNPFVPKSPPPVSPPFTPYTGIVTAQYALTVRSDPFVAKENVVSYLRKGDRVNIYAQSGNWGKISKDLSRWASLSYIQKTDDYVWDQPNPLYSASVAARWSLNVRSQPFIGNNVVDGLKYGEKVSVYKEESGWARISPTENRWVSAYYLRK